MFSSLHSSWKTADKEKHIGQDWAYLTARMDVWLLLHHLQPKLIHFKNYFDLKVILLGWILDQLVYGLICICMCCSSNKSVSFINHSHVFVCKIYIWKISTLWYLMIKFRLTKNKSVYVKNMLQVLQMPYITAQAERDLKLYRKPLYGWRSIIH